MKGANRGKTTEIISNFLSYPFHLDALITAQQRTKSGVTGGAKTRGRKSLGLSFRCFISKVTAKGPNIRETVFEFKWPELSQTCRIRVGKDLDRSPITPGNFKTPHLDYV